MARGNPALPGLNSLLLLTDHDRAFGGADKDFLAGYFATLGIPLVTGRGLNDNDRPQSEPVVIVNDMLAQTIWPGEDPIGKQIQAGGGKTWLRVVGVVGRVRHGGPTDEYENQLYLPYRQANSSVMFLVARTSVPPESMVAAIRSTLRSMDSNIPAFEIRSMKTALEHETALPPADGAYGRIRWPGCRTRRFGPFRCDWLLGLAAPQGTGDTSGDRCVPR